MAAAFFIRPSSPSSFTAIVYATTALMSTWKGEGGGQRKPPDTQRDRVPLTFSRPSELRASFQLFMYSPGNLSLLNTPTVFPSLLPLMASIILSKLPLLLSF